MFFNTGGNADVKYYVGKAMYSTDTWCVTTNGDFSDYLYLYFKTIRGELDRKFFHGSGLKHLQKDLLKQEKIYIPVELGKVKVAYSIKLLINLKKNVVL